MIAALLLALNVYPSLVPGYATLCVTAKPHVVEVCPTPKPTATPSATPSPQPTATPTPQPTPTPVPTSSPTPIPTPTPQPTATPTTTPSPSPTPTGTVIWQAGSPTIGAWEVATDGQCGTPVQSGSSFLFQLTQNGTTCYRNQANPLTPQGGLVFVNLGQVYTWTWSEIDGPPPGMGPDTEAESLVWQVHGLNEPHTPCLRLGFIDGPNDLGGPQMLGLWDCSGIAWAGTYTPGESDEWRIQALISEGADGWVDLYRNGVLQGHFTGANAHESPSHQYFYNFGPYKWRWSLPGAGGSTMTSIGQTINEMELTTP